MKEGNLPIDEFGEMANSILIRDSGEEFLKIFNPYQVYPEFYVTMKKE